MLPKERRDVTETHICEDKGERTLLTINHNLGFREASVGDGLVFKHSPDPKGPVTAYKVELINDLYRESLTQHVVPIEGIEIAPGQTVNLTVEKSGEPQDRMFQVVHDAIPSATPDAIPTEITIEL